jgi:murein L,D-transpeptidase YafK
MTRHAWRRVAIAAVLAAGMFGVHGARAEALSGDLPGNLRADKVVVLKGARQLLLLSGDRVIKSFRIALGRNPDGPKIRAGDGRTPEGHYVLDRRNPASRFHRSIHISYPAPVDIERSRALHASPGGDIMIHGVPPGAEPLGSDQADQDWTEGCIALSNPEIDEIWGQVSDGTPIDILP